MKKIRLVMAAFMAMFAIGTVAVPAYAASECGGTKTQLIACDSNKKGIAAINEIIRIVIVVMTVLIGIVATGGLVYAALLYASAQDDQSKVSNAKIIARNVVIGILMYGFMVAIINWLVPGGVIG